MRISEVLKAKGADVITVSPDATVRDLVCPARRAQHRRRSCRRRRRRWTGIVSERDVVRGLARARGPRPAGARDHDRGRRTARPDQSVDDSIS